MNVRSWAARLAAFAAGLLALLSTVPARADESSLKLPDLASVQFMGADGRTLLLGGMGVSLLGFVFGISMYMQLKNLPVHKSMREISELIYETCKTYLVTQIKFIALLEGFIGVIMVMYFGVLRHMEAPKVVMILIASMIGIAGSCGVAWFGIRINTFANSRTAFASLKGKPFPTYEIPPFAYTADPLCVHDPEVWAEAGGGERVKNAIRVTAV